jgi:hypothetical protein
MHVVGLINNSDSFFMKTIPFGAGLNFHSLFWHKNNKVVTGKNEQWGMRLFNYTSKHPFQNKPNMIATGHAISEYVNNGLKNARLIMDENRFFYFRESCVWSSLTSLNDCVRRLVLETNEKLNNKNHQNPYFWKHNELIIRKYFYPNKLNIELATIFNAPLEEIDESINRTDELLKSVEQRLAMIKVCTEEEDDGLDDNNNDPKMVLNYKFIDFMNEPASAKGLTNSAEEQNSETKSLCDDDLNKIYDEAVK